MKIVDTVNPVYGFKISFYEDDRWIGQHTQKNGIEIEETKLFRSILTDRTLVLDVGANLGWYSLVFAQTMRNNGWQGVSVGFEPESTNFDLFKRNIALNEFGKYIQPEKIAIGHENTVMKMWLSLKDGQWINRGDHRLNRGTREHSEDVDLRTLDWYITNSGLHDTEYANYILKVDVQGFEFNVLKGAKEFLSTRKPIHLLIEFNRGTGEEHFDFIKQHFGKIQILGGGEAKSFDDIVQFCEVKQHTHANLYAVRS